jgi:hypothetical protein
VSDALGHEGIYKLESSMTETLYRFLIHQEAEVVVTLTIEAKCDLIEATKWAAIDFEDTDIGGSCGG